MLLYFAEGSTFLVGDGTHFAAALADYHQNVLAPAHLRNYRDCCCIAHTRNNLISVFLI